MAEIQSKKKILIPIIIAATVVLLLILGAVFYAVAGSPAAKTKKSIELSKKYLAELNYEQAALAFESVLELDPLCVEAYLGLSEAYVGMADAAIEAGDTEKAEALYVKAMEALEAGYEATKGTSIAEKLEEIGAIYEEEFTEEEAEDSELLVESGENEQEAEPEVYPFVSVKDIFESAMLEGRLWNEWTTDELIAHYGLTHQSTSDDGSTMFYREASNTFGASISPNNISVYRWAHNLTDTSLRSDMQFFEYGDGDTKSINYSQRIASDQYEVFHESVGAYCMDHGLTSFEAVKSAFDLDNIVGDDGYAMIDTEYGISRIYISESDGFNSICFYFDSDAPWSSLGFMHSNGDYEVRIDIRYE